MRIVCSALLVAGAALLGSSGTIAAPVNGGAIKAAADEIGIAESVHCRPFRHWHRYGGYSRGCRGPGVVIYNDRPRLRMRYGVRSRDYDTRVRTGVTIRSEERSTIRSGTTIRSGGGGGSATIRSGGGGEGAPRVTGGGQTQGAAGSAGGGGGQGGGSQKQ
ncbi:MAG: hypothetical protein QOF14_2933 [Hyphomicrobiales bacterium]|nr:hypothetical protein [Hyphomicrobiales bacterium]